MVAETRYSMLMHPEVGGVLSVTLRGVTLREALESIRDVYGYDFKIEGRRVTVFPPSMQMRIFTVNYLHQRRQGRSEVRVSGSGAPINNTSGSSASSPPSPSANGQANTSAPQGADSSRISTTSTADFWAETADALRSMVGTTGGRNVIVSPHAGTIAVRAMPDELRLVESFLRASRLAIERQVMLEAKIIEVELRDGFQSGIDWSTLGRTGNIGQTSGYAGNALLGNNKGVPTLPQAVGSLLVDSVTLPVGAGGTLGLALATKGFQAVLGFLESHGDLQVLSSPRVATLNNQKAVLKVGTDEYFVTNVSGGTVTSGSLTISGTTTLPALTLTPFFSGIALDVTPQIDEANMITLHLRPSVTTVTEKTKQIDLGAIGNYRLPLASSSVNETDTVVRVQDGHIVAIGGLMQIESTRRSSGLPGSNANAVSRTLLSNQTDSGRKKELVVLIRPTIIRSSEDWERTTAQALGNLDPREPRRVITVAPAAGAPAAAAPGAPPPAPAAAPQAAVTSGDAAPAPASGDAAPAGAAVAASTAPATAASAPASASNSPAAAAAAAVAAPAAVGKGAVARPTRQITRRAKPKVSARLAKPAPPALAQPATAAPIPAPATVAAKPGTTLLAWAWPTRW
ncbi:MAG: general secretion pathway protein GspD [Leptothrix sp. (in: Bacteria)]|nr:general secretion pathway protein GspD [Leptothrix sp. (in: b-proteobacteria)]